MDVDRTPNEHRTSNIEWLRRTALASMFDVRRSMFDVVPQFSAIVPRARGLLSGSKPRGDV
jgi:hypothetical protein